MNTLGQALLYFLARRLERNECDAVLGDLVESGESLRSSLVEVLGLVVRRQWLLWKNWRPWLAAFGLALPGSFLLMGLSITVSTGYEQFLTLHHAIGFPVNRTLLALAFNILLLVSWSWTGGFVVGSLARRTVWVSVLFSFAPCFFCLARFRVESLSRLCLLLFLPPAVWGLWRGLVLVRIRTTPALILAASLTLLTVPLCMNGFWVSTGALTWPAWYLVAASRQPQGNTTNG